MASWSAEPTLHIKKSYERSAQRSQARRTGNVVVDLANEEIANNAIMRSPNGLVIPQGIMFEIPAGLKKFAAYGTAVVALAAGGYAVGDRLSHVLNPTIVTNEQVTTVPDRAHGPLATKTVTITTETPHIGG